MPGMNEELSRLRATVTSLDDSGQRNFMRELTMQTHTDFKDLQIRYMTLEAKVDLLYTALYDGDDDTPALVSLARRISIWLDISCRIWKWVLTLMATTAAILPLILWWSNRI